MKKRKYTPAEWVIEQLGGVRPASRLINRSPSSVCRWRKSKILDGCGGSIPVGLYREILKVARRDGYDINEKDLINGRTI